MLRDIVFDENTFSPWNDVATTDQNSEQFTVEYLVTELGEGGEQHHALSLPPAVTPSTPTLTLVATPTAPP